MNQSQMNTDEVRTSWWRSGSGKNETRWKKSMRNATNNKSQYHCARLQVGHSAETA